MPEKKISTADLAGLMADPDFDMHSPNLAKAGIQGTLFPVDALEIPESVRSMRKAVAAIHALPSRAETQTLMERKLMDAFIIIAQLECRGRENEILGRLRDERISPLFEVNITRIATTANIPGKNYKRVYDAIDNLYNLSLTWNVLGEDAAVLWDMKAHFFSLLGYGKGYRRGVIRFAFDPDVLSLFLEPSVWTRLSLDALGLAGAAGGMKSSAAYALFQNTWRYFGTQNKVTAALPVQIWVELMVGKGRFLTKAADGKQVIDYGEFKRRVLTKAISHVNESPALHHKLELREIRAGNKVTKLQFKFIAKPMHQDLLPLPWNQDVIRVLSKMGFHAEDVDALSKMYTMDEVGEALTRLAAAEARQKAQGKQITSRRAYFEGILRNIAGGKPSQEDEKLGAELRAEEAKRQAEERKQKLQTMFQAHQHSLFENWFGQQTEEARAALVEAFLTDPETSKGDVMLCNHLATKSSNAGLNLLRVWVDKNRPSILNEAFPNPEDRSFGDWLAWRATGGDALG